MASMAAWLRDELSRLLRPLTGAAASPAAIGTLVRSLGCISELETNSSLGDELVRLANLAAELPALDPGTLDTWDGFSALLDLGRELFDAMRSIEEAVNDPSLADEVAELGRILVEQLLSLHLRARYPGAFRAACSLTLIVPAEAKTPLPPMDPSGELVRLPVSRDELHLERGGALLEDPGAVLRDAYFPGQLATAADAHVAASRLFPILQELVGAFGFQSTASLMNLVPADPPPETPLPYAPVVDGDSLDWPEPDEQPEEPGEPPVVDLGSYYLETLPRLEIALPGIPDENGEPTPGLWGLSVVASSAEHPEGIRGFLVGPAGSFDFSERRGAWQLTAESSGALPAFVIGPDGVTLAAGAPGTGADVLISVERIAGVGEPAFLWGAGNGSHVALSQVRGAARGTLRPERAAVAIAVDVDDAVLVIAPGDGDGFLRRILPAGGLRVRFDLGLMFSSDRGLQLRGGGGGMRATIPVSLAIGPLRIEDVELTVDGEADGASVAIAGTLAVRLGPVTCEVTGLGLRSQLMAAEAGGNLGPVDLAIGFEPPSGVGLVIDTSAARGGGFLSREGARYTGALALRALGVGLSAYGVLDATGNGYSLVGVLSSQFQAIPLGLGFTLDGVGGLLGVQRRIELDAIRTAVRGDGIGELFFAADPVAHAARLLGDLATYFPAAEGRHVFGPAATIGWGTPTIVEATVALLLEVPAPVRLALLGKVSTALPSKTNPIIELNVDVLGDVDFARKTVAIDATLHDSKVVGFEITGDMALRMGWGDPPSFALSVGGFHSQFRVPPGFPTLRPIKIPIGSGNNPRLDITGFLALTSNTAQVGAQVELYAAAGPLNIAGNVGFEALLQFLPFAFQADLWGGVALRRGTRVLAGVHVDGTLRGPIPWRVAGEACLSTWFGDLCVGFEATFGQSRAVDLPAREVWPLLKAALEERRSWSSPLPSGAARAVVTGASVGDGIPRLDPSAALAVRQKVVPLNRTIERFAHVRPIDAERFEITRVVLGTTEIPLPSPIEDWFAPAQFEALGTEERLSRPGFEKMVSGGTLAGDVITTGDELITPVAYETITFPSPTPAPEPYRPDYNQQIAGTARAANANAPLRPPRSPAPLVTLDEEAFVIASTEDLTPRLDLVAAGSRGAAELALRAYIVANPAAAGTLQVVPRFEAMS